MMPLTDAPGNSWSTGTRTSVAKPLRAHPGRRSGDPRGSFNDIKSGAKTIDLDAQVSTATEQNVAYITILIRANDLCTRTVAGMTSIDDFRSRFEQAMSILSVGSPRARIYIVSIPNVYRLWAILKDDPLARLAWRTFDVCQSYSRIRDPPNPRTSRAVGREAAQHRLQRRACRGLRDVCPLPLTKERCTKTRSPRRTSPRRDYFIPRWRDSRVWPTGPGPRRLISRTSSPDLHGDDGPVEGGTWVILAAVDDVIAVAGIEFRLDLGPWQRYAGPFVLVTGSNIRFRAVDVNGNIEATHELTA